MIRPILFLICLPAFSFSQAVSLQQCLDWALEHHPVMQNFKLLDQVAALQQKNLSAGYLPSITAGAQATWQSEVIKIPIEFPGINIPSPTQDQYKISLDVNQIIWDGGAIEAGKTAALAKNASDKQNIKIQQYQLQESVIQVFFASMLADEQLKINEFYLQNITQREKQLQEAIANGVSIPAELQQLQSKKIELQQQALDYHSHKATALQSLSLLTGRTIDKNAELTLPPAENTDAGNNWIRPELMNFHLQRQWLQSQTEVIKRTHLPKFFLFGTAAYGRPGLNFLSNDFEPYAIIGAKAQWNISSWYNKQEKRDLQIIALQQNQLLNQEATWAQQNDIAVAQNQELLQKLSKTIEWQSQRLALAKSIRETAEAQLANGVISYPELLEKITDEESLNQSLALYHTQQLFTQWKIKWMKGGMNN